VVSPGPRGRIGRLPDGERVAEVYAIRADSDLIPRRKFE
jgi:hypothetical protein